MPNPELTDETALENASDVMKAYIAATKPVISLSPQLIFLRCPSFIANSLLRHDTSAERRGAGPLDQLSLHLDEIARTVTKGAHAVLLLDRAGWHTTAALAVPSNITMILLPSRAPELNPVENIWQYLRA